MLYLDTFRVVFDGVCLFWQPRSHGCRYVCNHFSFILYGQSSFLVSSVLQFLYCNYISCTLSHIVSLMVYDLSNLIEFCVNDFFYKDDIS